MVASVVLIVVVLNFIRMRKFDYTKDDTHSTRTLAITEEQEEDLISSTSEVMQEQASAPEYAPTATETLQPDLFIVISGGEKRERLYLEQLERQGYQRLLIKFRSPQGKNSGRNQNHHLGSAPKDIYSYWLNHYNENQRCFSLDDKTYHLEDIDQIFLLTDLDNFRPQLKKLLSISPNAQYRWIISNPCFEIWLYYSYIDSSPTEYLKELLPLSEEKRPAKLKYLLSKFEETKGGADPRKAFLNINTAIINARKHNCAVDKDNIPKLFCTQMDFLAEQIWARIAPEMIAQRADSFKKQLRNKQINTR